MTMPNKPQERLQPCITQKPPFSIQVPGAVKKDGEGIPRRHPGCVDGVKSHLDDDCRTTYDIVMRGARKFGDLQCMGSRQLIQVHEEKTMVKTTVDGQVVEVPKMWSYFEKSGYTYISFNEYSQLVHDVGSGLRALGLDKGDRIQIFAATR